MNPLKLIFGLDRLIAKAETFLLVSLVIFLLTFAFLQVFLRNFFDSGIAWGDVFNRGLVLWVSFFGATLAAREQRHFSLEMTKFLPKKLKPFFTLIVSVFVVGVAVMLTYYSYLFCIDQFTYESADTLFTGFPKAYFTLVFPLGFGLLTFRFALQFLDALAVIFTGESCYN